MQAPAALFAVEKKLLLTYWRALAQENAGVVTRKVFNPAFLKPILPSLAIIEKVEEDNLNFRLVGTLIDERLGRSLTNVNLLELGPESEKAETLWYYGQSAEHNCGLFAKRRLNLTSGSAVINSLILPFSKPTDKPQQWLLQIDFHYYSARDEREGKFVSAELDRYRFIDIGNGSPKIEGYAEPLSAQPC